MATINLTNKQLRLIQNALELYSRIGILQFERIFDHPTIENVLEDKFRPVKKLEVGDRTERGDIVKIGKTYIKTKGHWGKGEEIRKWTDIENIKLSIDYGKYHQLKDLIGVKFSEAIYLISGLQKGASYGIHNDKVDESCREAFDIVQVIRHEFWKENENRSNITVDSHISLTSELPKVSVKLDDIKEIRKQKLNNL
jgi:hypothetical protein